jgi:hypothetical protein
VPLLGNLSLLSQFLFRDLFACCEVENVSEEFVYLFTCFLKNRGQRQLIGRGFDRPKFWHVVDELFQRFFELRVRIRIVILVAFVFLLSGESHSPAEPR